MKLLIRLPLLAMGFILTIIGGIYNFCIYKPLENLFVLILKKYKPKILANTFVIILMIVSIPMDLVLALSNWFYSLCYKA
jgi:hypothetical protein